ncbi:hypothetical protein LEP1GSC067_5042 [Leptospira interrogans serovar Lora str. TE 1992]|uniref:Uncharacterized protein n=1 Tax=Leptospira interrogans serovar Lora str. TE 1992 TaxID=1193028 RepID=M3ESU7_LEPIR|nr:hypothetical protein LEP1GSC087_1259 [Leptospira interrogans serovar Bataviae str. L1111]EMF41437.1 hypothetical protein LEP1GSC067_5042 [Leptospira interrogans serovar Lora str. TE 1992]
MRKTLLTKHQRLLRLEEHNVKAQTVLIDNGCEYCGKEDQHPFELFLQLEEIEQRIR